MPFKFNVAPSVMLSHTPGGVSDTAICVPEPNLRWTRINEEVVGGSNWLNFFKKYFLLRVRKIQKRWSVLNGDGGLAGDVDAGGFVVLAI
jgi:hypothetical protein